MGRRVWTGGALALLLAAWGPGGAAAQAAPADTAAASARPADEYEAVERPAERIEAMSLVVDLSERRLYVMSGDEEVRSYPVAIGKPQHPTPRGEFRIRRLVWNPRWVPPDARWARGRRPAGPGDPRNPMGRVKIFFRAPDYYIHGTRDEDSLGEAESHGCIRMRNADVVELGRLVMVNGGEPRDPGWFRQVINRVRSTREVGLSAPVVVKIRE